MSFEKWKSCQWGDIATLEYGKSLKDYSNGNGSIPVFGTNGAIGFTDKPLWNKPGIIIGRKGAYRGVHFSSKPFFVIDTAFYLKPKTEDLDIKYAYYQLLTQDINSMDSGSAIPSTSREDFYGLEISLPPLATQRRIAALLTALDDKIELNRRMNETLEGLAQAVWGEWFGGVLGGEGELPEGWQEVRLGDCCTKITKGTTPTTMNKPFVDSGINFIKVESITENGHFLSEKFAFIDDETNKLLKRSIIEKDDILFTIAGSLGRSAIVDDSILPANTNQAVSIIRPDKSIITPTFLKYLLRSNDFLETILSKAVHAVQANISLSVISDSKIVLPNLERLAEFEKIQKPIQENILNNVLESRTLTALRDALLPRLMGGEIEI